MANRRMLSKTILDSDKFLEMPLSAQALYVHLAVRADDDGFVCNSKIIIKVLGAAEDDMKLLADNGYVLVFDSGLIVIRHWRLHNSIRSDRYTPTVYADEMSAIFLDENKIYQYVIPNGNRLSYQRLPQGSTDKGKSDKENAGEEKSGALSKNYGEYHHVTLNETQYNKLICDYGENLICTYIRKVDEYCQRSGKTYSDYNLTIRDWIRKDCGKYDTHSRTASVCDTARYGEEI